MAFTHLEVHSHFTLLGAAPSVDELVARAAADRLESLALTDTHALYGLVAFSRACRRHGLRPISGMCVRLAGPVGASSSPPHSRPGQVVLLAATPEGYRALCRLSTRLQGVPARETILAHGCPWEWIESDNAGLLCLSGGSAGWLDRLLAAGETGAANAFAARLAGAFGDRARFAVEAGPGSLGAPIAEAVETLARRLGVPTVAVSPVTCLRASDLPRLALLDAIRENKALQDGDPVSEMPSGVWRSQAEMADLFRHLPGALERAGEVAGLCQDTLPRGRTVWPAPDLPFGRGADETLSLLAESGLTQRYGDDPPAAVRSRLEAELRVVTEQGFAPLFLVVADIVRFARLKGIPSSTRGSVANSLVAYCTGITTVDPIEHDLLFERFLNPARSSPPDIDMDFCSRRRDEVLAYVRDHYGSDRVALIGAISTLQPQSAAREAGKALGLPQDQIDWLAARMPRRWHPDPRRQEPFDEEAFLATITDPLAGLAARLAFQIVGHPDHLSIHAGGIVIAPGPLTDHVPLQWTPKGFLITQYPHEDVEEIGLPKMDLLGIRALTVLADAAALVREREDPAFDLDAIADGDLLTAEMLRAGATIGVFQCDSEGAQRTLRKLQASGVRDLAVANAFFKPGPSTGGMAPAFVRRYRGEEPPAYLHPSLGPILGNTKGVLIFQEQVLRVAREVAGLSWAQADRLRRGMSKFQPDEIAQLEQDFLLGCRRLPPTGPGLTEEQSVRLWKQVHAFSGYGFNQGHATAYAEVSYRSAYLKAHHPEAFFCARLADWGGYHHPAVYAAEAVRLGIPVRPPHVNHSLEQFSLSGKTLWMGLGQIRDLRHSTIAALVNARRDRPFLGLFDLIRRVAMHAKELDHLVRCGALDGLGLSRAEFLGQLESTGRHQDAEQLSFGFAEELPQPCEPESMAQRLAWETELLGWPVSVNPLEPLAGDLPGHQPLGTRPASPSGRTVVVGYRLPGWTGGPSFLFADGSTFITVERRGRRDAPRPWLPVALAGRWQEDPWGGQWFEAEEIRPLAPGL